MISRTRRRLLALVGCLSLAAVLDAQDDPVPIIDQAAVSAREEFRRGVQAYHRYAFNEAILSLEKALSYKNEEPLLMDWLGRAYYRSGLEDSALGRWREALTRYPADSGEALALGGRIETVRNRRGLLPELDDSARYVGAGRYPGKNGDIIVFRQPTAVLPNPDGSVWVVAYGSNEIIRIDVNGIVKTRLRGPAVGFDRPYDIARAADGRLFVSEYMGNRISILSPSGEWLSYIGEKGRGDGQFVGPQNLAVSYDGYLYVVDFGNRRIQKLDDQGNFILSFGQRNAVFTGFSVPTGLAVDADSVYVADAAARRIARFDQSGNFLSWLGEAAFNYPESLRLDASGRLLVADTTKVVLLDPNSGYLTELSDRGKAGTRLVCADVDANGNIVAANFLSSEVEVLARIDDLASGLFVQIDRIVGDKFPEITVELSVQDRRRRPIVGLENRNFVLIEGGSPVADQKFLGSADVSNETAIAILVERSERTVGYQTAIRTAVADLAEATTVSALVSAAEQPILDNVAAGGRSTAAYGAFWRFDLGLRLAATEILPKTKKRAVVFVSSGRLGERAFDRYGPSELASYLANNGIAFNVVLVGDGQVDAELRYLCDQTGGGIVGVYDPAGLAPLIAKLQRRPVGSYTLRYRSTAATDFGRAYLSLSAEAYLLDRSGRDVLGYFSPLE